MIGKFTISQELWLIRGPLLIPSHKNEYLAIYRDSDEWQLYEQKMSYLIKRCYVISFIGLSSGTLFYFLLFSSTSNPPFLPMRQPSYLCFFPNGISPGSSVIILDPVPLLQSRHVPQNLVLGCREGLGSDGCGHLHVLGPPEGLEEAHAALLIEEVHQI